MLRFDLKDELKFRQKNVSIRNHISKHKYIYIIHLPAADLDSISETRLRFVLAGNFLFNNLTDFKLDLLVCLAFISVGIEATPSLLDSMLKTLVATFGSLLP